MKTKIIILSLLTANSLFSQEKLVETSEEVSVETTKETKVFLAPRLAGDTLPIKPIKRDTGLSNVNSISEAFKNGKVKGLIRYNGMYRDSDLHLLQDGVKDRESDTKKQQYSVIGGHLGYETAPLYHTSVGATLYTAQKAGNNPDNRLGLGGLNEDNGYADSYSVLGEAFLKFKKDEHRLVIGRQELPNYRFISLNDVRMTPTTHQGITYENTILDGFQFNLAYIQKEKYRNSKEFVGMARAAGLKTGCSGAGIDPITGHCLSGGNRALIRGEFDRVDYLNGDYSGDQKSMPMAAIIYKKDSLDLELWDYHAQDFVNVVYFYGAYNYKPTPTLHITAALQYAHQDDVGDSIAGDINTWFYGLKLQASHEMGITYFLSYNEVKYDEDSYDGGSIFLRWGSPQMFNSFQVQDSELGGVNSIGVGLQLELGRLGLVPNTVVRVRYGDYNYPDSADKRDARQDRTEATLDIRYSFTENDGFGIFTHMKGLSLLLRIAYNDYDTSYNFQGYEQLNGYSLDSVTSDFTDSRFYLEYRF